VILLGEVRHQVAIVGRVKDAQTGVPVAGARVELTNVPAAFAVLLAARELEAGSRWASLLARPDRVATEVDGHFHFLDLPDGQYTVVASLPQAGTRYATAQLSRTISRDAAGTIARAAADLELPPTAIKGRVTDQGNAAVPLAQVRLAGGAETTYTDGAGDYLLGALEAGNRTLVVTATGFQPAAPQPVALQPGAVTTANVKLSV
jgi:hypothetical protein